MTNFVNILLNENVKGNSVVSTGIIKRVGINGNLIINSLILKSIELNSNCFEYPKNSLVRATACMSLYKLNKSLPKLISENFISVANGKYSLNLDAINEAANDETHLEGK